MSGGDYSRNSQPSHNKQKKEACKHFNKGLCTAGLSCKYNQRCLECGNFGHGAHICRKRAGNNSANNQQQPGATAVAPSSAGNK